MSDYKMYSTGEMADVCNISKRTLRHYEKIALLVPEYTDPQNNYRYYNSRQVGILLGIKVLQEFGFSLEKIKGLFASFTDNQEKLLSIFSEKKKEINAEIKRLTKLESKIDPFIYMAECLRNGEFNRTCANKVVLKEIEKRTVVSIRYYSELTQEAYIEQLKKFDSEINRHDILTCEPTMSIFYRSLGSNETSCEYDILRAAKSYPEHAKKYIKDIPSGLYASIMHKGPHKGGLRDTFTKLYEVVKDKNYKILNYPLIIYHVGVIVPESEMITEMQLPVEKNNA
jgi:DNA-binding transcriptional MerR regulator